MRKWGPALLNEHGMRSRHSTFLALSLALATFLMWLERSPVVPTSVPENVPTISSLATHLHVSSESPQLRSCPSDSAISLRVMRDLEPIDLEEEDGHFAALTSGGLDLQPIDPPAYPFLLATVEPERATSLFLSLRRFRC
jgi:hypothetical protein